MLQGSAACGSNPQPFRRTGEQNFRALAVRVVTPRYPSDLAISGLQGVAVAELRVGPDGRVRSVSVLQSPHPEITREMQSALTQWQFSVPAMPGALSTALLHGKLTYYFVVNGGQGAVLTAAEKAALLQRRGQ